MAKKPQVQSMEVLTVPVDLIEADYAWNSRKKYEGIDELAKSILNNGQMTAVEVTQNPSGKYVLLSGFRRFKAITQAKIPSIRIQVKSFGDLKGKDLMKECRLANLRENIERSDLSTYELALACVDLRDNHKMTTKKIVDALAAGMAKDGLVSERTLTTRYVNELMRCATKLCPEALAKWEAGETALPNESPMNSYRTLAKYDHAKQKDLMSGYGGDAKGDQGSGKSEPKVKSGRPSKRDIARAIEFLEATSGHKETINTLKWVLGDVDDIRGGPSGRKLVFDEAMWADWKAEQEKAA